MSINDCGSDNLEMVVSFGYMVRIVRIQPITLLFLQLYKDYWECVCERFTCYVLCYRQTVVKSCLIVGILYIYTSKQTAYSRLAVNTEAWKCTRMPQSSLYDRFDQ